MLAVFGAVLTLPIIGYQISDRDRAENDSANTSSGDSAEATEIEQVDELERESLLESDGALKIMNSSNEEQFFEVKIEKDGENNPLLDARISLKPDDSIVSPKFVSETGQYSVEVSTENESDETEWEVTDDSLDVIIGFDSHGELSLRTIALE